MHIDEWGDVNNYPWTCVAGPACEKESDSYVCKTFQALEDGGTAFFFLEITSMYFIIVWIDSLIHLIIGNIVIGPPVLNYFYPITCFLFHLAAIASWFVYTEAEFKNECDNTKTLWEK